ncbi:MAG: 50S ribosomal protein L17 [Deltaproteobacteria bacterium]|nr:50S ribosomal protein L17 [Deltaproteobacteria bacterium]
MRHLSGYSSLGRASDHRRAMLRNMTTSFLIEGRIRTSLAKARALRPIVEKMITLGKRQTLHARRQVLSYVFKKDAVEAAFGKLSTRFNTRPGGYTRIIKLGQRSGDATQMAYLELVDFQDHEGKVKADEKKKRGEKKAVASEEHAHG